MKRSEFRISPLNIPQQTTAVTRVSTSRALTTMNNRWMQMMRRRPNASLNLAPIFSHFLPISSSHNRSLWSLMLLALPSPFIFAQFRIILWQNMQMLVSICLICEGLHVLTLERIASVCGSSGKLVTWHHSWYCLVQFWEQIPAN